MQSPMIQLSQMLAKLRLIKTQKLAFFRTSKSEIDPAKCNASFSSVVVIDLLLIVLVLSN